MSGKPRKDRTTIASHHLGLRLTGRQHDLLTACVRHMSEKLRAEGVPAYVSASGLVTWLIEQEAKRLGVDSDKDPPPRSGKRG
jgi:hypothetical protein